MPDAVIKGKAVARYNLKQPMMHYRLPGLGISFARKGQGVVLMTNSDKGRSLIDKILRGMNEIYNWNHFSVLKRKKISR